MNRNPHVQEFNKNLNEPYARSLIFHYDPVASTFSIASPKIYNEAIEKNIVLDPRTAMFYYRGEFFPMTSYGLSSLKMRAELNNFDSSKMDNNMHNYRLIAYIAAIVTAAVLVGKIVQSKINTSELEVASTTRALPKSETPISTSNIQSSGLHTTTSPQVSVTPISTETASELISDDKVSVINKSTNSEELEKLVEARDNFIAALDVVESSNSGEVDEEEKDSVYPNVHNTNKTLKQVRELAALEEAMLRLAEESLATIMSESDFDEVINTLEPLGDYLALLAVRHGKASLSTQERARFVQEKLLLEDALNSLDDLKMLDILLSNDGSIDISNESSIALERVRESISKVLDCMDIDTVAEHHESALQLSSSEADSHCAAAGGGVGSRHSKKQDGDVIYSAAESGLLPEELESLSTEVDEGDHDPDTDDDTVLTPGSASVDKDSKFFLNCACPKCKFHNGDDNSTMDIVSPSTSNVEVNQTQNSKAESSLSKKLYVHSSDGADIRIFSGNGNELFSHEVCAKLNVQLARAAVSQFADGEIGIQIIDSVRGKDCYVVQSLCGPNLHDRIMELLLMVSSLRRSSAARVTAIIPYMSYARQLDQNTLNRSNIGVADFALMLESMGTDHVVAVDLHRPQVAGFFPTIPVENLDPLKAVIPYLIQSKGLRDRPTTIVAPAGVTAKRAAKFQQELQKHGVDASLAFSYIVQEKGHVGSSDNGHHGEVRANDKTDIVGLVADRDAVIVDDMIDSGSRVCSAAEALKLAGARKVYAFATHGLFSGAALKRIRRSNLDEVVVFNTVPLAVKNQSHKIRQLSAAGLVAEPIRRLHNNRATCDVTHNYAEYS